MIPAYSSNGLTEVSLECAAGEIAARGFAGIEVLLDLPHWKIPGTDRDALNGIKKLLRRHQLVLTNLNANDCRLLADRHCPEPRPLDPNREIRRRVRHWHLQCLEFAAELNAAPISIATGPQPAALDTSQAAGCLREHFDVLVPRATALGVPLTIEFEPDHFLHSWATLAPWLAAYNSPCFGVNFDIGHAAVASEPLPETLVSALPKIMNIHLEDIHGGVHEHLVPGTGDLPLTTVLAALEKNDYRRGLTVELYNHAHRAAEALDATRLWFENQRPGWLRPERPL